MTVRLQKWRSGGFWSSQTLSVIGKFFSELKPFWGSLKYQRPHLNKALSFDHLFRHTFYASRLPQVRTR